MSKAFTREENEGPDTADLPPTTSALPPGAKNYITRAGADRLREELARLLEIERPRLSALSDDGEAKRKLSILDQRIFQLEQSLQTAEVISHASGPTQRVTFGATVTVRDELQEESVYRIVGVDEVDAERGWVSWLSPIARALINAKVGEEVRFKFPSGEQRLKIVSVIYE